MGVGSQSAARVVGIESQFVDPRPDVTAQLPQSVAMIGQGNDAVSYSTDPVRIESPRQALELYGPESPLHRMATVLRDPNGSGLGIVPLTAYPLEADGAGVAAIGGADLLTSFGTSLNDNSLLLITLGGREYGPFSIVAGTSALSVIISVAVLIDTIEQTVFSAALDLGNTGINLTARWSGETGNELAIALDWLEGGVELPWTIVPAAGGANNPDVTPALDAVGSRWETLVVNAMNPDDDTALQAYNAWGEDQWDVLTHMPAMVVTGSRDPSLANAQAITATHVTDRTNVLYPMPGITAPPWEIAANAVSRMAQVSNENPAQDYTRQLLSSVLIGDSAAFFTYDDRNVSVEAGISTSRSVNGVVQMADTVTMYHPDDGTTPAFRDAVDIAKLQNIIFRVLAVLAPAQSIGAPLVPDSQTVTAPEARKPMDVAASLGPVLDGLALDALISDPESAKDSVSVGFDGTNPKRLNIGLSVKLAGNANIVSVDLNFGFGRDT